MTKKSPAHNLTLVRNPPPPAVNFWLRPACNTIPNPNPDTDSNPRTKSKSVARILRKGAAGKRSDSRSTEKNYVRRRSATHGPRVMPNSRKTQLNLILFSSLPGAARHGKYYTANICVWQWTAHECFKCIHFSINHQLLFCDSRAYTSLIGCNRRRLKASLKGASIQQTSLFASSWSSSSPASSSSCSSSSILFQLSKAAWRMSSDGARVFAARGKRLCCRPHPRNQISNNCYSYGYNDGISVDCEQYAKLGL